MENSKTIYISCYQTNINGNNQKAKTGYYDKNMAINELGTGGTIYSLLIKLESYNTLPRGFVLMEKSKDRDVFTKPIKVSYNLIDFNQYKENKNYRIDIVSII